MVVRALFFIFLAVAATLLLFSSVFTSSPQYLAILIVLLVAFSVLAYMVRTFVFKKLK